MLQKTIKELILIEDYKVLNYSLFKDYCGISFFCVVLKAKDKPSILREYSTDNLSKCLVSNVHLRYEGITKEIESGTVEDLELTDEFTNLIWLEELRS